MRTLVVKLGLLLVGFFFNFHFHSFFRFVLFAQMRYSTAAGLHRSAQITTSQAGNCVHSNYFSK